ncbi:hypothetical protein GCM10023196_001940 [Actinoallomurus vinaceus]|uniref:Uncharacterized protein n=1 Tax=Actinoallomurus vinaceus TaxID=1080074 RepID=A0ABP8U3X2_9ACTN
MDRQSRPLLNRIPTPDVDARSNAAGSAQAARPVKSNFGRNNRIQTLSGSTGRSPPGRTGYDSASAKRSTCPVSVDQQ